MTKTKSRTERPAEYYKQWERGMDVLTLTQRVYQPNSEKLILLLKDRWCRYCKLTEKDPVTALKAISINILIPFFDWLLSVSNIGAASTLQTYWIVFNQMRRQETGCLDLEPLTKSRFQSCRQHLAINCSLDPEKKKKAIMRAEDEFELMKTLYTSNKIIFNHERHRVELALLMQLGGITGNRPSALLAVRYEHVKVTPLKDPNRGEWPRVLIEIIFAVSRDRLDVAAIVPPLLSRYSDHIYADDIWDERVPKASAAAHAKLGLDAEKGGIVVVRPDGHVSCVVSLVEGDATVNTLNDFFGAFVTKKIGKSEARDQL